VRPHHVGQPLFSFTTHDENMRRNSNHFTSHIVMLSCWRNQRSRETGNHTIGAISIDKKPTSSSSMSLCSQKLRHNYLAKNEPGHKQALHTRLLFNQLIFWQRSRL